MSNGKESVCYNNFFAAANAYCGFANYFGDVFLNERNIKTFILKGGPGTGKSTLMKRLSAFLGEEGFYREQIYCSSDTASLDGIIAEGNKGCITVFDGTPPHAADVSLPGAADVLVNLGEGWCEPQLESQRSEIEALNKKKAAEYQTAYLELKISSVFDSKIRAEILTDLDKREIRNYSRRLFSSFFECENGIRNVRLLSAFGKDGRVRLSTLNSISKEQITIDNSPFYTDAVLSILDGFLTSAGTDHTYFPSAPDTSLIEAIYVKSSRTAIVGRPEDDGDFIHRGTMLLDCKKERDKHLDLAKNAFRRATEYHFLLEKIYSPLMDFGTVDRIYDSMSLNIKRLLSS